MRMFLPLLTILALTGCTQSPFGPSSAKQLLTPAGLDVLRNAQSVEAYRFSTGLPTNDQRAHGAYTFFSRLAPGLTITVGKPQDALFARRLADVLTKNGTYLFNSAKGCKFRPTVGYHLSQGNRSLDVVLCFGCDEVKFIVRNERGEPIHTAIEDFDPARARLLLLAQDAFPDDPEISAMRAEN